LVPRLERKRLRESLAFPAPMMTVVVRVTVLLSAR
jgi:hypothetical protein